MLQEYKHLLLAPESIRRSLPNLPRRDRKVTFYFQKIYLPLVETHLRFQNWALRTVKTDEMAASQLKTTVP